jgi:hypothetical protein
MHHASGRLDVSPPREPQVARLEALDQTREEGDMCHYQHTFPNQRSQTHDKFVFANVRYGCPLDNPAPWPWTCSRAALNRPLRPGCVCVTEPSGRCLWAVRTPVRRFKNSLRSVHPDANPPSPTRQWSRSGMLMLCIPDMIVCMGKVWS